jgi:hypothetical protein
MDAGSIGKGSLCHPLPTLGLRQFPCQVIILRSYPRSVVRVYTKLRFRYRFDVDGHRRLSGAAHARRRLSEGVN